MNRENKPPDPCTSLVPAGLTVLELMDPDAVTNQVSPLMSFKECSWSKNEKAQVCHESKQWGNQ